MKRILSLIFIGVAIAFTGCTEEANTAEPSSANEATLTKETEKIVESTTENITDIEMSDEEYLINLGKQLKLGMTEEEVTEKIGEPDGHAGSGLYWLEYYRGDCVLRVYIDYFENELYSVRVGNGTTNKTTYVELEDDKVKNN